MSELDRRHFLTFSSMVAAGGVLAACSSSATSSSGPTKAGQSVATSLVVNSAAAPSSLNTFLVNDGSFRWLAEGCLETLYRYDDSLAIVPCLADGMPTVSADKLTYTIKLRTGVTFHNGKPLDAEEVVATLTEASQVGNWSGHLVRYYKSSRAVDANTVEITLAQPFGLLMDKLSTIQIVHSSSLKSKDIMIGTGPFQQAAYVPNSHLILKQFPQYYASLPKVKELRFNFVPNPGVELVNLRNGSAAVLTQLRPSDYQTAKAISGVLVSEANASVDILWQFNFKKGPFTDPRVCKAVALATDRARVRDVIYGGQATLGQGPLGPAIEGYTKLSVYSDGADIAQAKSLLKEAGVPNLTFNVIAPTLAQDLCTELQSQWKAAGINATMEVVEIGTWVTKWTTSAFDLSIFQTMQAFSVGITPYQLVVLRTGNPLNFGGYSNPVFDDLVDRCFGTSDRKERARLAGEANQLIAEAAVWVPPAYPKYLVARREEVPPFKAAQLQLGRLRWQDLA